MNNRERIINTVLGRDVEERETTRIVVDRFGIMQEIRKEGSSISRFIDDPVKDGYDWERLKRERLNPLSPDRFPTGWGEVARQCNEGNHAIQLGWYPYGLFGYPQSTDIMVNENKEAKHGTQVQEKAFG